MSGLRKQFLKRIGRTGPIPVAEYMAECLLHPEYGYYATQDPFGRQGDFITAPEITQMFGELIGLAVAQAWLDRGGPTPFTLAELGPGRGTLMADMLRATRAVPGFHDAARLCLVEASPALRQIQRKTLDGHEATWLNRVEDLPEAPLFLIANEFFDALPIHQYTRKGDRWRERLIGRKGGKLGFGLGAPLPAPALDPRLADTKDGDVVETCPAAGAMVSALATRIEAHDGLALIIDYGDWRSQGDTLQAVRAHSYEDPLAYPGKADLTAHVDFEALALAAPGLSNSRLTPQGVFLERLGITQRAQALATQLGGPALENHIAAHRRLTHPDEMGTLFKVMALTRKGSPPPPGLTE